MLASSFENPSQSPFCERETCLFSFHTEKLIFYIFICHFDFLIMIFDFSFPLRKRGIKGDLLFPVILSLSKEAGTTSAEILRLDRNDSCINSEGGKVGADF
jgi:hypothetical protein